MKVVRVYTGGDGKFHFEDIEVEFSNVDETGKKSDPQPATGIVFRETGGEYNITQGVGEVHCAGGRNTGQQIFG